MAEYIDKDVAINTIMGQPPDAHYPDWYASQIEDIPAADVAPVVHCRDCARLNRNGYCTRFQNNISGIATSWFMPDDDDFCSYGERKE